VSSYAAPHRSDVPEESPAKAVIVCPVSRWYFRRIGLIAALFVGLGLYFFYDGAIGYPRANFHAALFEAFEAGKNGEPFEPLAFDGIADLEGKREELRNAHETGSLGGSWAAFAAARHLGEARPDRHSAGSIRQQFVFGWVLIGLTGVVGVYALIQRNRKLRVGADWLETPGGKRIDFSRIAGVDFSKWDRGIALLEIAEPEGGSSQVKIDDYRYSGAADVVRRIGVGWPEIRKESWPKSVAAAEGSPVTKE